MMLAIQARKLIVGPVGQVVEDAAVVIDGERIKNVGPAGQVRMELGDEPVFWIDAGDRTLMPGVIDLHTHITENWVKDERTHRWIGLYAVSGGVAQNLEPLPLRAIKSYRNGLTTLRAGITTIRDVGARYHVDVALRDAINHGVVLGPRMQVSGQIVAPSSVTGRGTLGTYVNADGPDEVLKRFREQLAAGVDLIKVLQGHGRAGTFTVDELRPAIAEAHRSGIKVAVHAASEDAVKEALKAGADTIEHGGFCDDEVLELMEHNRATVVPTIAEFQLIVTRYADRLTPEQRHHAKNVIRPRWERRVEGLRRQFEAGVRVGMGTDISGGMYSYHGNNMAELAVMCEFLGMTPAQSIAASTIVAAEAMGWGNRIGSLEPGKYADLLVVDGDPLADITILQDQRRLAVVMKGGWVFRSVLADLPEEPLDARPAIEPARWATQRGEP